MIILRFTVALPNEFVALTVKLGVPIAVGVPVIAPVSAFKLNPVGNVPLDIDQVMGFVPFALNI